MIVAGTGESARAVAERLERRHRFATLVMVDCDGRIRPGLATSWRPMAGGTAWTFVLSPTAAFDHSSPAAAVRDDWLRARGDTLRWPGVEEVADAEAGEVMVRFFTVIDDPTPLFDPAYVIEGVSPPGAVPMEFRVESDPIVLLDLLDSDPLAGMADLVWTRNADLVEAARRRSEWRIATGAWDRVHLLLARGATPDGGGPSAEERRVLTRDAVAGAARVAEAHFWARSDHRCRLPPPAMLPVGRQVGYDRDDPVAQALAERIVAMALGNPPPWLDAVLHTAAPVAGPWRAVPLAAPVLRRGVAAGTIPVAVMAFPVTPPPRCEPEVLLVTGMAEIPLVETAAHLLLRGATPPLTLLGDGTFLVRGFQ